MTTVRRKANYRVSLSAITRFTRAQAAEFYSIHIELHSLFGQYAFVIEINKDTPQSHQLLQLAFAKDIKTGTYPVDGSSSKFHQLLLLLFNGRPEDEKFTQYEAKSGTVHVEAHRDKDHEHFSIKIAVTVESADGESFAIEGKSEIYLKHRQ
ncbi:hypothetical protein FX985_00914 [Pseudomonas extremaustralis]|uniref:Uncharacterized protein n=1 Tax=Pseudomonas extremaustralis TaxID=359110 RepID=A0A5M9IVQ3_9PSED|nr:hypothetical protein [Pseudomonas extremaustralis]KAA8560864.1 hypothetical protein FX985_00914 [Pseudomonas extremaustralis]